MKRNNQREDAKNWSRSSNPWGDPTSPLRRLGHTWARVFFNPLPHRCCTKHSSGILMDLFPCGGENPAFTNFPRSTTIFGDSWATPNRLGVLNLQEKQARAKLLGGNSSAQLDQHFCFCTQINPLKSLSLVWVCLLGRVEGESSKTCAANEMGKSSWWVKWKRV